MSQELPTINGELLRLRRETRGWALSDLATRACMSVKQIRQLEEGGASAFYSETVKWTSAKKVGALLGMQPEEVFVQVLAEPEAQPDVVTESATTQQEPVAANTEPVVVTVQEPASDEGASKTSTSASTTTTAETPEKSKTPVFALAALFAAALAVAAWMRPEPEVVTEPVPPLQNIAAEATDAKPASDAAVDAVVVASQAQKPVSASSATASSVYVPAAAVSASSPASAVVVAKPANAAQAPASAASAASKPL